MEEWKFFNIKLIYKQAYSEISGFCLDCYIIYILLDEVSINYLYGKCYRKFHYKIESNNYASPRLGHLTDYDMNNVRNKEYANYPDIFNSTLGTSATGKYFANVPVGNTYGITIVFYINFHRAHATPFDDILRWNYKRWSGNSTDDQNGCLACHTTKY